MTVHHARSGGFTLVEVLVALVIMALLALMAWQGVDGIVRARDRSQEVLEQTLRLETVIAQWEHDVVSVQDTSVLPPIACAGPSVRMTRRAPEGVQVVTWSMRSSPEGGYLQRWAARPVSTVGDLMAAWRQSELLLESDPAQLRMLGGLEQWQIRFYATNAWYNCGSAGPRVPEGVQLVLGFAPGQRLAGALVRDLRIAP